MVPNNGVNNKQWCQGPLLPEIPLVRWEPYRLAAMRQDKNL